MRTLLVEVAGIVEAPVDRVAELVLTVRPGNVDASNGWLFQRLATRVTLSGGPNRYAYRADGHGGTIEVDHAHRVIAYQGGWWYRGEYALQPCDRGTRLVHRVRNVASRARWAVPLANKMFIGFRGHVRSSFAQTLARIGAELGCASYVEA